MVPDFPQFKLTVNDFNPPFSELEPRVKSNFLEQHTSMSKSHDLVVNSFYELEASFNDYWIKTLNLKLGVLDHYI